MSSTKNRKLEYVYYREISIYRSYIAFGSNPTKIPVSQQHRKDYSHALS